jgi:hypothetical protein
MQEAINRILNKYLIEKHKEFAQNKLAHFLRSDVSTMVQEMVDSEYPDRFKVSASPGQGQWAEIPWIGVFDKDITESPTEGYFVMYIFTADMSAVYLSLNQGWLFFKETFGAEAKQKISIAAEAYRKVLGHEESFDYDSITLGTDRELGVAYELGHIYGKKYEKGMVPGDETLKRDLLGMIALYERLKGVIGTEFPEERIKKIIFEHESASQASNDANMTDVKRSEDESVKEGIGNEGQPADINFLTLEKVSERSGLPVDRTEEYLDKLEKSGICLSKTIEGEKHFPLESPELVSRLDAIHSKGLSLKEAIETIREGDELDSKKLEEMEQRIEKLSRSIDSLSALLRSHVARYHSTPEKKGFCYHIKQAFKSIGSKKE